MPSEIIQKRKVKGFDQMLFVEDVAIILRRPVRWVRENLINSGVLPSIRIGGNSVRIKPSAFEKFMDNQNNGFRSTQSSGSYQKARFMGDS